MDGFHIPLIGLWAWSLSLERQSVIYTRFFFFAWRKQSTSIWCLCEYCEYPLFAFPLCYRSKLAKPSPPGSPGVLTFSSLKESRVGKAGHPGDGAQICPQTIDCWWRRTHEEIQMGFPFLSYWYTSILMQWELAGEIQGLLVMEKLWLA